MFQSRRCQPKSLTRVDPQKAYIPLIRRHYHQHLPFRLNHSLGELMSVTAVDAAESPKTDYRFIDIGGVLDARALAQLSQIYSSQFDGPSFRRNLLWEETTRQ